MRALRAFYREFIFRRNICAYGSTHCVYDANARYRNALRTKQSPTDVLCVNVVMCTAGATKSACIYMCVSHSAIPFDWRCIYTMFVVVLRVYEICAAKKGWFSYGFSSREGGVPPLRLDRCGAVVYVRCGTGLESRAWYENV